MYYRRRLVSRSAWSANAVALVQSSLRVRVHDSSFTVPGATPDAQLQAIVPAVLYLKNGCLKDVYDALTPESHHGGGHHDRGPGGDGPHDGHGGPGGHNEGSHRHP